MTMHFSGLQASDAPLARSPELRELVRVARAYLAGQVHVSHVATTAAYFQEAARFLPLAPDLKQMAAAWSARTVSVWPSAAEPAAAAAAEETFRHWVAEQLAPFAAVELPTLL